MVQKVTKVIKVPATEKEEYRYACDVCDDMYPTNYQTKDYEKQHTCAHPDVVYGLYEIGSWSGIEAHCPDCKREFPVSMFNDIEDNRGVLKVIYELIPPHIKA